MLCLYVADNVYVHMLCPQANEILRHYLGNKGMQQSCNDEFMQYLHVPCSKLNIHVHVGISVLNIDL